MASDFFAQPLNHTETARVRPLLALWINIQAALESIGGNVLRSFLTVLGVVIGVASVIILVAFGDGARVEITGQIDTLGSNVAVVMPGKLQGQSNFNPTGGLGVSNISDGDVEALRQVKGVRAVAPLMFLGGGVFRGDTPASICMPIATVPAFQQVRRLSVDRGRFFTDAEMEQPVCVLGTGILKDLFKDEDPLGKKITVSEHEYTIIGVVSDRAVGSGLFGGDELNAIVYIPMTLAQKRTETKQIHRIFVEITAGENPDAVVENARQVILARHDGRDDFSFVRAKELL